MTDTDVQRYCLQIHRLAAWEGRCVNANNIWGATTAHRHLSALTLKIKLLLQDEHSDNA